LSPNLVNEKEYPEKRIYANAQLPHAIAVRDKLENHGRQGQAGGTSVRHDGSNAPLHHHDAGHR